MRPGAGLSSGRVGGPFGGLWEPGVLAIKRRTGEVLVIGEGADRVCVEVLRCGAKSVRLGVHAPEHVRVDRAEVREAREAREARALLDIKAELGL